MSVSGISGNIQAQLYASLFALQQSNDSSGLALSLINGASQISEEVMASADRLASGTVDTYA